jgi:hypothetical protein
VAAAAVAAAMMGLCSSCFGKKYQGGSALESDSYLAPDAEKLLASSSPKISVFSGGGGGGGANSEAIKIEKILAKSEASDSGTCIDEFCDRRAAEQQPDPEECRIKNEQPAENSADGKDAAELPSFAQSDNGVGGGCGGLELENVQVTLSSVGSLGGILEEVPEAAELDPEDEEENSSSLQPLLLPATEKAASVASEEDSPLLLLEGGQGWRSSTPVSAAAPKPGSEDRHHSFGSKKSILSSVMAEGNF